MQTQCWAVESQAVIGCQWVRLARHSVVSLCPSSVTREGVAPKPQASSVLRRGHTVCEDLGREDLGRDLLRRLLLQGLSVKSSVSKEMILKLSHPYSLCKSLLPR